MNMIGSEQIRGIQSNRQFRNEADGDEPLRQRFVAYAIALAELDLDPDNPKRMQAVKDFKSVLGDYVIAPMSLNTPLHVDPELVSNKLEL